MAKKRKKKIGIASLIGKNVVLDTAGPLTYLGKLLSIRKDVFELESADVRDRSEGHVSKERYVWEAREQGIKANRRKILVFRSVVVSVSALDDVIVEYESGEV